MQTYRYTVLVLDGANQSHLITGTIEAEKGDLRTAADAALRGSFEKLVGPHATVTTCGGPYTIDHLEITRERTGS